MTSAPRRARSANPPGPEHAARSRQRCGLGSAAGPQLLPSRRGVSAGVVRQPAWGVCRCGVSAGVGCQPAWQAPPPQPPPPQPPGLGAPHGVSAGTAWARAVEKRDSRRTVSAWPSGQGVTWWRSWWERRRSNTRSHERHRNSYSGTGSLLVCGGTVVCEGAIPARAARPCARRPHRIRFRRDLLCQPCLHVDARSGINMRYEGGCRRSLGLHRN